jgi:hypothetical protein
MSYTQDGLNSKPKMLGDGSTGGTIGPIFADAARVRALAAYKAFLELWKDAEPGIPIYKEARAEYAKLLSP